MPEKLTKKEQSKLHKQYKKDLRERVDEIRLQIEDFLQDCKQIPIQDEYRLKKAQKGLFALIVGDHLYGCVETSILSDDFCEWVWDYVLSGKLIFLDEDNLDFIFSLPYDKNIIQEIKKIEGRKWNPEEKYWQVPANNAASAKGIQEFLKNNDFLISEKAKKKLSSLEKSDSVDVPKKEDVPKKKIELSENGVDFVVSFPYDELIVQEVKKIQGRRWNPEGKNWTIPAKYEAASDIEQFAEQNGFSFLGIAKEKIASLLEQYQESISKTSNNLERSYAANSSLEIAGLSLELRPFQRAGVDYAVNSRRCFIADEMGLGKTIQALATLQAMNAFPAIVVCPASLKLNWEREIRKWLPGKSVEVTSGTSGEFESDITIINYSLVKKNLKYLVTVRAKGLVFDESHYLKSHKAQRTIACKELAKYCGIILCLTGTPIVNRPYELVSQLEILGRLDEFGGFWNFATRYCNAYENEYGWDFSGAANLSELNEELRKKCMVRRTKKDVLTELPDKQRTIVPLTISNQVEYRKAEKNLIRWLCDNAIQDREFLESIRHLSAKQQRKKKSQRAQSKAEKAKRAEQLVRIETLKQLTAKGKIKQMEEWIESFLLTGEKLVIFAHHDQVIKRIANKFDALSITGKTPLKDRQEYVDKFQNSKEVQLLVLNIKVGGVGLTLTAASNVAFLELGWTPAEHDQAEDRCHRIGQESKVNAWYFIAKNTIEDEIVVLLEKKRAIVDSVSGGDADELGFMGELIDHLLSK